MELSRQEDKDVVEEVGGRVMSSGVEAVDWMDWFGYVSYHPEWGSPRDY